MGFLHVDPRHPTPLYAQIEQGIRGAIGSGRLAKGAQLPTVRQLAVELSVNANTVARVYADLEQAGLLETRRGVGTFVAATPPPAGDKRRREAELRAILTRCLDEAAAHGFSVDDVVRHVKLISTQQGG